FRVYLDRHPNPRPVLEWAIRWLETHIPPPLGPVLCHRDFRTGNYMLDSTELTGILDWEFAGWGDPDEDIGWFCCKGWRFARLDRRLLLDEVLPLLPPERHRDLHLVATAIAIAARETAAGEGAIEDMRCQVSELYALSALQGGEGGDPPRRGGKGEMGIGERSGIPRLTPALSAPQWTEAGGEGVSAERLLRRFA